MLIPIIPLGHVTHEAVASMKKNQLKQYLKEQAVKAYESKEAEFPNPEQIRELEAGCAAAGNRPEVDGSH